MAEWTEDQTLFCSVCGRDLTPGWPPDEDCYDCERHRRELELMDEMERDARFDAMSEWYENGH